MVISHNICILIYGAIKMPYYLVTGPTKHYHGITMFGCFWTCTIVMPLYLLEVMWYVPYYQHNCAMMQPLYFFVRDGIPYSVSMNTMVLHHNFLKTKTLVI